MIWLSTLCILLSGLARYIKGASESELPLRRYTPTIALSGTIAALTGIVGFIATNTLLPAVIVGLNAGLCVHIGCTKWGSILWQIIRGGAFGLLQIVSLTYLVAPLPWQSALGMLGLYILGYGVYYGVNKINLSMIEYEKVCRFIQGSCVCSSALFL